MSSASDVQAMALTSAIHARTATLSGSITAFLTALTQDIPSIKHTFTVLKEKRAFPVMITTTRQIGKHALHNPSLRS